MCIRDSLDYAANKEQLADDRRYQAEGDIEAAVNQFRNPRKQFDAIFGGETKPYQEGAASIYDY